MKLFYTDTPTVSSLVRKLISLGYSKDIQKAIKSGESNGIKVKRVGRFK